MVNGQIIPGTGDRPSHDRHDPPFGKRRLRADTGELRIRDELAELRCKRVISMSAGHLKAFGGIGVGANWRQAAWFHAPPLA